MVLKAMPTGRANARPMTGSASSADAPERAPYHEVDLLPSSREAAGRGRGWGVVRHSRKQRFLPIDPPPPTPPRHARCAWREGSARSCSQLNHQAVARRLVVERVEPRQHVVAHMGEDQPLRLDFAKMRLKRFQAEVIPHLSVVSVGLGWRTSALVRIPDSSRTLRHFRKVPSNRLTTLAMPFLVQRFLASKWRRRLRQRGRPRLA